MKPDWKDAPAWAEWLAMDSPGFWWWYASEPEFEQGRLDHGEWLLSGDGDERHELADGGPDKGPDKSRASTTLEPRP